MASEELQKHVKLSKAISNFFPETDFGGNLRKLVIKERYVLVLVL